MRELRVIVFGWSEEAEGVAVEGSGTEASDCLAMGFCGVAFVDFPVVAGVLGGEFLHQFIAVGLGEYRGGCYRHVCGVAFDYGCMRDDYAVGDSIVVNIVSNVGIVNIDVIDMLDNVGGGGVRFEAVAVYEDVLGADGEGVKGAVHAYDGGIEDVYAVDLLGIHHHYCPRECVLLNVWT